MATPGIGHLSGAAERERDPARAERMRVRALRGVVLAVVGVAVAVGASLGAPEALATRDAEWARLLRGMAGLKAVLVAAGAIAVGWRFAWPLPRGLALAYLLGLGLTAGATASIWRLSHLGTAAVLFHAGLLLLLVAAWRDTDGRATALGPRRVRGPGR